MTIHRLKLKDLNPAFLQKLQSEHTDGETEVAIWMQRKAVNPFLSEAEFWKIIEKLDWSREGNDEAVIEPVIAHLSELSEEAIFAFEDILSEKLYLLDGEKYAKHTGKNAYKGEEYPFSVDTFLYARCCVVANGKAFFEKVLKNPKAMPKNLTFEALLGLASKAFKRKTGKPFEHIPAYIYETFANSSGWEGEDFIERILNS